MTHYPEIDDLQGQAASLIGMGIIALKRRDLELAMQSFVKALAINRNVGYALGQADALFGIAKVHNSRGERQRALSLLMEARGIFTSSGAKSDTLQLIDETLETLKSKNGQR